MNTARLNDQYHFTNKGNLFFTIFYLLSEPTFRQEFPDGYEQLHGQFHREMKYGGDIELNLDTLVTDSNHIKLAAIVGRIWDSLLAGSDIQEAIFKSDLLQEHDKKETDKAIFENYTTKRQLMEYLFFLQTALCNYSFYTLSNIDTAQLAGEWISTKESGQLRINYNMTDFTPIGNQIRLRVQPKDDGFYSFECFATVVDYHYPDKTEQICVRSSLIKAEGGYIHHYSEHDRKFYYKSPVYGFGNDGFTMQVGEVELRLVRLVN